MVEIVKIQRKTSGLFIAIPKAFHNMVDGKTHLLVTPNEDGTIKLSVVG